MPKILITGNGFDLNLGLPTSYNDFIKILSYIENNELINFKSIFQKCSNYEIICSNFKPFKIDIETVKLLRNKIKENIWYRFFLNEFNIETWIDFENKIEYVLKILFSSVEKFKSKIFSKGSLAPQVNNYLRGSVLDGNVELIQVLNSFNIINSDYVNSAMSLKDTRLSINTEYLINKYGFYVGIDMDKITIKLNEELNNFKQIFNLYFEAFVFPFYNNIKNKVEKDMFYDIEKHFTFNYTPTFEKIYFKKNITKYLHGKIDSKLNKIVLGINEVPNNIDKKYYLPFTKYFQKLNNNTDYNFIKEYEKKKTKNYMFFFWGHSLDKSDEDYINEVFDFINELKSEIKKIIIIYHNEKSYSKLLLNLLYIRGKTDIQDLMKNDILVFRHINSNELKNDLKRDIRKIILSASIT